MPPIRSIFIGLAAISTVASTLAVYPHQLAYFNELSGGPENGHRHLLHSNLDWGQDYLLVRRWMKSRGLGCEQVALYAASPAASTRLVCDELPGPETADWVVVSAAALLNPERRDRIPVGERAHVREQIGFTHWVFVPDRSHGF